ncbi:excalibur calcium-binding domain-containing protein [Nocardioides sp. HB32]
MFTRTKTILAATALTVAPLAVVTTTASEAVAAGKYYSSCDALHRDFKHGVSKSKKAAKKQVRDGYGLPAYGKRARAVYNTNHSRLDRDKDGIACEA